MKKLLSIMLLGFISFSSILSSVFAVNSYTDPNNAYKNPNWASRAAGIDVIGTETGQWENLIQVVKNAINWILGILALITLVLLLWGWFQMVTAAWDEKKYEAGFTILKQAAFGLMMIWVAWFVVSIIFFVINLVTA